MSTTEEIWDEYHSSLLAFIRKRVNEKDAAEDILQDIFVRVHSRVGTLTDGSKLESWLYRIARNAVIDFYRSRKPLEELPEWLEQPQIGKDETTRRELSSCLISMIQLLPEKYRQAVQLSEIQAITQREIAEMENISISGAKSRVQRGRALLKTLLGDCCRVEINAMRQVVDYEERNDHCGFC